MTSSDKRLGEGFGKDFTLEAREADDNQTKAPGSPSAHTSLEVGERGQPRVNPDADTKPASEQLSWEAPPEANQQHFDRRWQDRKTPPRISFRIQIQRFLNTIVYKICGSRVYQLLLLVITITAGGVIWYSANHRAYLVEEAYRNLIAQGQLETKILQINQEWTMERMEEIRLGVANADRRRVFSDYQNLASWLRERNAHANELNLRFSYTLGEGQRAKIDNTLEVPIQVTLVPMDANLSSSYSRIMDFTRHLVSTLWYVDVQEATVVSEGAGAAKMTAEISVWVHGRVNADG